MIDLHLCLPCGHTEESHNAWRVTEDTDTRGTDWKKDLSKSIFLTGHFCRRAISSQTQTNTACLRARRCCVPPFLGLSWYVIAARGHSAQVDLICESRCLQNIGKVHLQERAKNIHNTWKPTPVENNMIKEIKSQLSLLLPLSSSSSCRLHFPLSRSVLYLISQTDCRRRTGKTFKPSLSILTFAPSVIIYPAYPVLDSTEHAERNADKHPEQERDAAVLSWWR